MAENKETLAEDRTDLAEDRTVLAHERSYAGWVRTGMAAVGIGLGLNALFRSLEPAWVAKGIATGFFVIAILIFFSAQRRACRIVGRLQPHTVSELGPVRIRIMTWSLVTVTVVLAGAIWLLVPA
ncbi:DUF202 domain-containing protein [Novosphingobium sp. RD2P27]|uniref:DUF202 domain-containing protein n=1 Tax=Novosphingobium kalidii TaxID=3230299 RepID=A0ABV2D4F6_9SPHN